MRIIIDAWSPLSHKSLVGDPHLPLQGIWTAPSWVPLHDRRRIGAYTVRAAYRSNVARLLLPREDMVIRDAAGRPVAAQSMQQDTRRDHREYGDADLIVDRVVAGVLGNEWALVVDGADDDLPDEPELPEKPDDLAPDADAVDKRIYAIRTARWEAEAQAVVDQWEADWTTRPTLQGRQDALRVWADDVQLAARLDEAEHDAAGLGDTVLVAWPRKGDWPRIQVYDPGFYFPVLDDDGDEDYPLKVHLAWEIDDSGDMESAYPTKVRRITFELVELTDLRAGTSQCTGGRYWLDAAGAPSDTPLLAANEQVDENGHVYRLNPWDIDVDGNPIITDGPLDAAGNPTPQERRSYRTCVVTDATWPIGATSTGIANLSDDKAEYRTLPDGAVMRRLDLGCDFLPLVHVPNTPSGKEHYGRAVIDVGAQVLDDLAQNDSDVMTCASYSAGPVVGLSGTQLQGTQVVGPGMVYNLGEKGTMSVIDLSVGLDKLTMLNERLLDRLQVTCRVPAEMIGRVSSNKAVSGVAMALAFAPFAQLVGVMRMSRDPKYRILLRVAQRLAQLQGVLPAGPSMPARVQFGNFLPSDQAAAVTMVSAALQAHAISTQTAVKTLVAAGFAVEDAQAEVDRIHQENTLAAVGVFDATGSTELGADWLGLEIPVAAGPGVAPTISLPPRPPTTPPGVPAP